MATVASVWREARAALRARPRELGGLLAIALLVLASYGFARPATESMFVDRYGSERLPWAWLGVGAGAVMVTWLYNRAVSVIPLRRLWPMVIAATIALFTVIALAEMLAVPHARFALYIWKDLYIVVLVELFWSIANVSFPLERARWLYGLFLAAGSLGGLSAELTVGHLADAFGSLGAIAAVIPILIIAAALAPLLPDAARTIPTERASSLTATVARSVRVVFRSRYLALLVVLVALVQIAITVIDYQYNVALEAHVPDMDERTGIGGQLYAAISACSLVLQLLSGLALKLLGVPLVLALIPMFLLAGMIAFIAQPRFAVMAVVKVASKAFDYSLGRASKELLYLPLTYAEKTEGKAAVDLLSYRVAKAGASGILLWMAASELGGWTLSALLVGLLFAWLAVAVVIGRRYDPAFGLDRGASPP